MANRIEVITKTGDTRAEVRKRKIQSMGLHVEDVNLVDVYILDDSVKDSELGNVAAMLSNPVTQEAGINQPKAPEEFDYAVEVGFLPGVTDNVGNTVREIVEDRFKRNLEGQTVYNSQVMFLSGNLTREEAIKIGDSFSNPNGSLENIARITDETGKVFGLMPHPERAISFTQLPNWTLLREQYRRAGKEIPEEARGIKIFENGVNYFK